MSRDRVRNGKCLVLRMQLTTPSELVMTPTFRTCRHRHIQAPCIRNPLRMG